MSSDNSDYLVVGCPQCGEKIRQPLAWSDRPFNLRCTACGFTHAIDLPELHESIRSLQEAAKLIGKTPIETKPFDAAGFAEYLRANPDTFRDLVDHLRKRGLQRESE
jgi:hypothetical protein